MSPLVSLGSFVGTMLVGSVGWWLLSDNSPPDDEGGGGDWELVPVPMAPCSASASVGRRTVRRTRCHRVFARSVAHATTDRANTAQDDNEEVLV